MTVRVVAGLGNPGRSYDKTRHNIGFSLVDTLAQRARADWRDNARFCAHTSSVVLAGNPVLLVKPQTFMNESGRAIGAICRYHRLTPGEVLVVYDEFQLRLGDLKVSVGGSGGGHNGIGDVIAKGYSDVVRLRIGIGPSEKPRMPMTDFVLGRFTEAEQTVLEKAWPEFLAAIEHVVRDGAERAMNTLNRRSHPPKKHHESNGNAELPGHRDSEHPGV